MKLGLIGSGFMGKAHVFGFAMAAKVFDMPIDFELEAIADVPLERAQRACRSLGFRRATDDWRTLVEDPTIGLIDVTAPNALHREIVLAAVAAGKHVYCEKPLALCAAEAEEMARAALLAGVKTQVGFNYLTNPLMIVARDMIAGGELGEIYSYRGSHVEDYMGCGTPYSFRHERGGGALADLGSHVVATAEFLLGPIVAVMGDCRTLIGRRRDGAGVMRTVEVDDSCYALLRFANGVHGSLEANWCATGRTMGHGFEIYGEKGSLLFSQQRMNELHFYTTDDKPARRGFRRIEAGPEHPPYGRFCAAPGHQIGFNDLKAIEIAGFAAAIAEQAPEKFNFEAGWRVQRVVEAIAESSSARAWRELPLEHEPPFRA